MSAVQLDPLFKGVTPAAAARTLAQHVRALGPGAVDRFVVPCVGNLTIPEALVSVGVDPKKIAYSDITLYTTALGYACDGMRSFDELGFELLTDEARGMWERCAPGDDEFRKFAALLCVMKWVQLRGDRDYVRFQRLQFEESAPRIVEGYAGTLRRMAERLAGAQYEVRDAHEVMTGVLDDPKVLAWYNPPGFVGGYSKMFAPCGHYRWDAPAIPELKPKDVTAFLGKLHGAKARVLVYASEGHALQAMDVDGWEKLYSAEDPKTRRRSYVLSNRKSGDASVVTMRRPMALPTRVPAVYDEHEITAASKIAYVKTTKDVALYFYDLFVRELGMVKAEVYYLFTIDGQVAGTCGFDIRTHIIKRIPILYETFGLSMTTRRHGRIGRLLMASLCCREFVDQFARENVNESLMLPRLADIQTTCLSKHPETKKNRGILKLVSREKTDDGRYHLVYKTPIHEKNFDAVLAEWLAKHAQHERE